jgi:hypothetical protein
MDDGKGYLRNSQVQYAKGVLLLGAGGGLYCPGPGPGSLWRRVCLLLPKVTGTTFLMVAMAWGPMVVKSPAGA